MNIFELAIKTIDAFVRKIAAGYVLSVEETKTYDNALGIISDALAAWKGGDIGKPENFTEEFSR